MSNQLKQLPASNRVSKPQTPKPVKPSIGDWSQPFTLDQELTQFGRWVSPPIWVPPKDSSRELAKSMLQQFGMLASRQSSWQGLIDEHRSKFSQVREIELPQASIRLPKGRLFVSVTNQSDFDKITDKVPNCVRTRLEEFLEGPGSRVGVKVYYLKPLCVEVGDRLIFTTREELNSTINEIRDQVFSAYRHMYVGHHCRRTLLAFADAALAVPRMILAHRREKAQRKIDAYQAKLEFQRRKLAMRAANLHRKCRTDGCEFDEMLALTNPLVREDVIEQYGAEHQLTRAERDRLIAITAVTSVSLPWFFTIPLALYYLSTATVTVAPPIMLCDPAFVAEMPGSKGVLLKIGHFDEVNGVTHVEI